ncbi:MAG: AIPR family protein [Chloroflexi bacterium]|nr:AIPR family protein [Chloroflexota bacterium]
MVLLDYPDILHTIRDVLITGRTESASFLCWYLINYYRLDDVEAVDTICDQPGDKGIDGIYVNENQNTIDVFQSKISQSSESTVGDVALKNFYGTLSQLKDRESVMALIDSAGDADVAKLIKRLNLADNIDAYEVRGIFLSNIDIDANGQAFIDSTPQLIFVGKQVLTQEFISATRSNLVSDEYEFDVFGYETAQYTVDDQTKSIIAPVKANELVQLTGIGDQSIFAPNLRGHLGNTKVNRDIVRSIKDPDKHKLFPLFHNGITVICENLDHDSDNARITVQGYGIVNGCQSMKSLYDNRRYIGDDLRVLTRFIKVDKESDLLPMITTYSNNQNGIKARDFKSNNAIQVRLQEEFEKHYNNEFFLEIKAGESDESRECISNEAAGLLLLAFDVKEPWSTHQKYKVFDEKYTDIFARPEVNADRIIFLKSIMQQIQGSLDSLENQLIANYSLTRYIMLYTLREILEKDELGLELIRDPQQFVRDVATRDKLIQCIRHILDDMVVDANAELKEIEEEFDYKSKFKSPEWVRLFTNKIVSSYIKLVQRGRVESFQEEWSKTIEGLTN